MNDCQSCLDLQNSNNDFKVFLTSQQNTIDDLKNKAQQATANLDDQLKLYELKRDECKDLENQLAKEKDEHKASVAALNDQISQLKDEMNANAQRYQDERDSLKKEINTLEQNLKRTEQDLVMKIDSETSLNDEISRCQDLIRDFTHEKQTTLEDAVDSLIKKTQESFSQNNAFLDKIALLEDKLTTTNQALSDSNAQVEQLMAQLAQTQGLLTEYQTVCGDLDQKNTYLKLNNIELDNDKFVDYYDCQVHADSFYRLLRNQPWPIEYKNFKNYQERAKKGSVCVSVLGYENTGKSFMVSKVMGRNLPQGKHVKTKGICILYPDDKDIAWTALDTPGTNVSIKLESLKTELDGYFREKNLDQEDIHRMLYGDNILIESLLQEFVVSHTQVLLILVGKLRRDDQRFINRIKTQKDLGDKRIIVVHNLLETREIANAKRIIKEDILETFETEKRTINIANGKKQCVYLERSSPKIEHVVMAHEGSEAGNYYNENTVNYIKQVVKTWAYNDKLDLVDAFHKYLNSQIKNFLSSNKETKDPFITQKVNVFEGTDEAMEMPTGISLQDHKNYSLKSNLSDEFGQLKTYNPGSLETVPFTVKLFLKDTPNENNNPEPEFENVSNECSYLQIELEVSGLCQNSNIKLKLETQGKCIIVRLKGIIEDNTIREDGGDLIESTRKFGEFIIATEPIDLRGHTIDKARRPTFSDKTPGLKILRFNIYKNIVDDEDF